MRSARVTNPAWLAATVPPTWCCSRDVASNPHPAPGGDLRDAGGRQVGGVEADGYHYGDIELQRWSQRHFRDGALVHINTFDL